MKMGKIELKGMQFKVPVGVSEEERKSGSKISIDLKVKHNLKKAAHSDDIQDTADYKQIYQQVKAAMKEPANLLETLVRRIMSNIFENIPEIGKIKISISKLDPPVGGPCSAAVVYCEQKRKKKKNPKKPREKSASVDAPSA